MKNLTILIISLLISNSLTGQCVKPWTTDCFLNLNILEGVQNVSWGDGMSDNKTSHVYCSSGNYSLTVTKNNGSVCSKTVSITNCPDTNPNEIYYHSPDYCGFRSVKILCASAGCQCVDWQLTIIDPSDNSVVEVIVNQSANTFFYAYPSAYSNFEAELCIISCGTNTQLHCDYFN